MDNTATPDSARRKATIRELLQGRTRAAENLAAQLDKYAAATAAVTAAQAQAATQAAKARESHQLALSAGWTAAELKSAGLKPPTPPRTRHNEDVSTSKPANAAPATPH